MSTRSELDTIAAIATPLGYAPLAVIRISGPLTTNIVKSIFRKGKEKRIIEDLEPWKVNYGFIVSPEENEIIDEVTLIFYKAPFSYTTEDMAEIICHGGFVVPRKILEVVIKEGARLAEKGEFTKRAFINGRIDLTEAEAILDIIEAKSETAYRLAVENLKGKLKEKITFIKDELTDIISDIEAFIDFDEDVEEINQLKVKEKLEKLVSEIDNLIKNYEKSKLVSEGAHIIITGKPNVGKSSLLNKLLERERAIVTEIPGTTRDTIEEPLVIDGILFKVIDTAGIRKPKDKVEEIGIERAIKKIEEADLVLFMIDGSEKIDDDDQTVISVIKEKAKKAILIVNKIDKGVNIDEKFLKDIANETNCEEIIYISAKTGEGIKKLKEEIKKKTLPENVELLINERHHACFVRAKAFLNNSLRAIKSGQSFDIVALEIKEAINSLKEITGEISTEDILNRIFSKFCIGK